MKVEVLYFDGCPNHGPTVRLVRAVAEELSLNAVVEEVRVRNHEDAAQLRFLGSPSVRIDGIDIEPSARSKAANAFACRVYSGQGMPPRELLVAALMEAKDAASEP